MDSGAELKFLTLDMEFAVRVAQTPLADVDAWREIAATVLRSYSAGQEWRCIKSYTMTAFYGQDVGLKGGVAGYKLGSRVTAFMQAVADILEAARLDRLSDRESLTGIKITESKQRLGMLNVSKDQEGNEWPFLANMNMARNLKQYSELYQDGDDSRRLTYLALQALELNPGGAVLKFLTRDHIGIIEERESSQYGSGSRLQLVCDNLRGLTSIKERVLMEAVQAQVEALFLYEMQRSRVNAYNAALVRKDKETTRVRLLEALYDIRSEFITGADQSPPSPIISSGRRVRMEDDDASAVDVVASTSAPFKDSLKVHDDVEPAVDTSNKSNVVTDQSQPIDDPVESMAGLSSMPNDNIARTIIDDAMMPSRNKIGHPSMKKAASVLSGYRQVQGGRTDVFLHCGGNGMQLGNAMWDIVLGQSDHGQGFGDRSLVEAGTGKLYPPCLFLDIDSSAADFNYYSSTCSYLKPWQLMWSYRDGSMPPLWSLSKSSDCDDMMERYFTEPIRKLYESVESVDSVIITHSTFGRAGSFFSSHMAPFLSDSQGIKSLIMQCSVVNTQKEEPMLSGLQCYLQSVNLTHQFLERTSDCTTLLNCDWSPRERFDCTLSAHAHNLLQLVSPRNTATFYPTLLKEGFEKTFSPLKFTNEWSFSKNILQHYIAPRPLSHFFGELKMHTDGKVMLREFARTNVLGHHSVVSSLSSFKAFEKLIIGAAHLSLVSYKGEGQSGVTSAPSFVDGERASWMFRRSHRSTAAGHTSSDYEIVSLVHSLDTINSLFRPAFISTSVAVRERSPFAHNFDVEGESTKMMSSTIWTTSHPLLVLFSPLFIRIP